MAGDFKLSATLRGHEEDVSGSRRVLFPTMFPTVFFTLPRCPAFPLAMATSLTGLCQGPRSRLSKPTESLFCLTRQHSQTLEPDITQAANLR